MILCISVLSVVISPFSFLIVLIWFFSLCFLMSLANSLSVLFYPLKEAAFCFVDFCYGLFYFFCIYFCPNFSDFFPFTNLGFFISFFSCFRCRVRLFIWLFSYLLRYACIAMNHPLSTTFTGSHRLLCFHFHSFLCIVWFLLFLLWFVGYSAACFQPPYVGIFNSFSPVIEI